MRPVALEAEMVVAEIGDRAYPRVQVHRRQRSRFARQLLLGLLEVVEVEVGVAEGMDESSGGEVGDLGDHQGQQRIGGDVERHAKEDVGRPLVGDGLLCDAFGQDIPQKIGSRRW